MKALLVRQRRLVIVFSVLLAWIIGFPIWVDETFTAPLSEPIGLLPAGSVEKDIRVRLDAPHDLQIVFTVEQHARQKAMQLLGNKRSCREKRPGILCDIAVPLRWSILDASGRVVASGEEETHGTAGWSANEIYRDAASHIPLPVGRYRFRASVLRDVAELDGMTARLSLVLPGRKVSLGWQSDLAFFGGILHLVLIIPITGSFGMILLGQAVGDWARGRRKSQHHA